MPGNERMKKTSLAKIAGERSMHQQAEAKHSALGQQNAHERRVRSRRSEEAADPEEDAMDVALGSEGEAWERRRSERRRNAA